MFIASKADVSAPNAQRDVHQKSLEQLLSGKQKWKNTHRRCLEIERVSVSTLNSLKHFFRGGYCRLLHCASFRGAPNHVKPCSLSFRIHLLPSIEWEEGLCPVLHEESCSKRLQICSPCPWSVDQPQAWQKKPGCRSYSCFLCRTVWQAVHVLQNTNSLTFQCVVHVPMLLKKIYSNVCVLVKYAHDGEIASERTLKFFKCLIVVSPANLRQYAPPGSVHIMKNFWPHGPLLEIFNCWYCLIEETCLMRSQSFQLLTFCPPRTWPFGQSQRSAFAKHVACDQWQ